ncbi:MAG: BRCT domain-containing protein [Deltaproteobacteria bacterium]|jgi:NAD-dependent DNA ligase|nr:BRCT domain-containing protein [Deltaproteobacteria bacterium]
MRGFIDDNGQPPSFFNVKRKTSRSIDELMGLCKGVLADKVVCEEEARFLADWFRANPEAANVWPGDVLSQRLEAIYKDNVVTSDELQELKVLLQQITGLIFENPQASLNLSSSLPFDHPVPPVILPNHSFCFTGSLAFGPRKIAEKHVIQRQGTVRNTVVLNLDYLVIGVVGSRDWLHSSFGAKIAKAVEYKEKGCPIMIISEDSFLDALQDS